MCAGTGPVAVDGEFLVPEGGVVDPEALAQDALASIGVDGPAIRTSPEANGRLYVRVPTWLWLEDGWWHEHSATASAGRVTATVTARPTSVSWSLGDGSSISCEGPGTPWRAGLGEDATDCSYTYTTSSAGSPTGTFELAASVRFEVTWTSNVGAGGALPAITLSLVPSGRGGRDPGHRHELSMAVTTTTRSHRSGRTASPPDNGYSGRPPAVAPPPSRVRLPELAVGLRALTVGVRARGGAVASQRHGQGRSARRCRRHPSRRGHRARATCSRRPCGQRRPDHPHRPGRLSGGRGTRRGAIDLEGRLAGDPFLWSPTPPRWTWARASSAWRSNPGRYPCARPRSRRHWSPSSRGEVPSEGDAAGNVIAARRDGHRRGRPGERPQARHGLGLRVRRRGGRSRWPKAARSAAGGGRTMSLIGFCSARGDARVTTTALLTAGAMAGHVLLVEADPSGGVLAVRYGLGREPRSHHPRRGGTLPTPWRCRLTPRTPAGSRCWSAPTRLPPAGRCGDAPRATSLARWAPFRPRSWSIWVGSARPSPWPPGCRWW
ncbi:MAG: hypothetical protein U5R31_16590 [Acidimicrobiia bacterium]|nr:hypothetical protein [Acidimicrobiia bacterium]